MLKLLLQNNKEIKESIDNLDSLYKENYINAILDIRTQIKDYLIKEILYQETPCIITTSDKSKLCNTLSYELLCVLILEYNDFSNAIYDTLKGLIEIEQDILKLPEQRLIIKDTLD